jgi:Protein of unknown function (DUF1997)
MLLQLLALSVLFVSKVGSFSIHAYHLQRKQNWKRHIHRVQNSIQKREHKQPKLPLFATPTDYSINSERRRELLDRPGSYWKLDKTNGAVEFGSTLSLTQQLNEVGGEESWAHIAEWLTNSEELAVSIWDPKYTTVLGNDIYRLQVMELRFVTLSIQPTVDVVMKTDYFEGDTNKPIFTVQSVSFDPKLQILPGMNYNAESLGIVIEVVGRLVPSKNGKSVTGCLSFTTSGTLPLALRILPESVMKAASDTINETISNFVAQSFRKGSTEKYNDFQKRKKSMKEIVVPQVGQSQ